MSFFVSVEKTGGQEAKGIGNPFPREARNAKRRLNSGRSAVVHSHSLGISRGKGPPRNDAHFSTDSPLLVQPRGL